MTPTELKQAAERLIELRDAATDGKSFINYSQSNGVEVMFFDRKHTVWFSWWFSCKEWKQCEADADYLVYAANHSRAIAERMLRLERELSDERAKTTKLREALEFYARHENWEVSAIDDLLAVKTKLSKDREAFGESAEAGLASKLTYYGGKKAREALALLDRKKNDHTI